MPLTIRLATPDDQDALARIYVESRLAHFHWTSAAGFSLTDFEQDSDGEVVHVACNAGGDIIGFISVWKPESFVHLLFIAYDQERQGVGKALLDHLTTWLPFPHRLKCVEANLPALAFYRSQGWQEVSRGLDGVQPYLVLERRSLNC